MLKTLLGLLINWLFPQKEPPAKIHYGGRRRKEPPYHGKSVYIEVRHSKKCQINKNGNCTCRPRLYKHLIAKKSVPNNAPQ